MGAAGDRRIGLDFDDALALTEGWANPLRLRFECSSTTGPTHAYADVHAELVEGNWIDLDVPVNAEDRLALDTIALIVARYGNAANVGAFREAVASIVRVAWGDEIAGHIMGVLTVGGTEEAAADRAVRALFAAYAADRGIS